MSADGSRLRLDRAKLVFRTWSDDKGVTEHEEEFTTLAELLEACLKARTDLPDRITLTGTDTKGRAHALTFSFASLVRG